MSMNDKERRQ